MTTSFFILGVLSHSLYITVFSTSTVEKNIIDHSVNTESSRNKSKEDMVITNTRFIENERTKPAEGNCQPELTDKLASIDQSKYLERKSLTNRQTNEIFSAEEIALRRENPDAFAKLVAEKYLSESDTQKKSELLFSLEDINSPIKTNFLLGLIQSNDPIAKRQVWGAIEGSTISQEDPEIMPAALAASYAESEPTVLSGILSVLGAQANMGPASAANKQRIVDFVSNPDDQVRAAAMTALAAADSSAEALRIIENAILGDSSAQVRLQAINALSSFDEIDADFKRQLQQIISDSSVDTETRMSALNVLASSSED